jgi:hypothetical protein
VDVYSFREDLPHSKSWRNTFCHKAFFSHVVMPGCDIYINNCQHWSRDSPEHFIPPAATAWGYLRTTLFAVRAPEHMRTATVILIFRSMCWSCCIACNNGLKWRHVMDIRTHYPIQLRQVSQGLPHGRMTPSGLSSTTSQTRTETLGFNQQVSPNHPEISMLHGGHLAAQKSPPGAEVVLPKQFTQRP